MIVDIHVHPSRDGSGIEEMLEAGRRAGIHKQVFMGIEKEMIDKFPDEIIGFVRGRCTDPESPAILEEYVKKEEMSRSRSYEVVKPSPEVHF